MSPATDKRKSVSDPAEKPEGKADAPGRNVKTAAKKPEAPKGKKKRKGSKVLIIFLIIFLILIVLLGGSGAGLYFTGNLNGILEKTGLVKPSSTGPSIAEQQAAIDKKAAELSDKEQTLSDLQKKLDRQKAALASAEAAASASPTFSKTLAGMSAEKLAELKKVGLMYSSMDAAAAAAIMVKLYDQLQIAVIVYNMQPAASALLLSKLDPELAAGVTKLMTN